MFFSVLVSVAVHIKVHHQWINSYLLNFEMITLYFDVIPLNFDVHHFEEFGCHHRLCMEMQSLMILMMSLFCFDVQLVEA